MSLGGQSERANAVVAGTWLIGLGILFATRYWWPGIMFVIGIAIIVQCWLSGRPLWAMHGGFWAILIGLWAIFRFSVAFLFVGIGVYVILSALFGPNPLRKPRFDNTLE
jgi:hypothetical protein